MIVMDKKKLVLVSGSLLLVSVLGFFCYKKFGKKGLINSEPQHAQNDVSSGVEEGLGSTKTNETESKSKVDEANKEVVSSIASVKVSVSPTYQSAEGYEKGLDLYHRMISTCAVLRKDCNSKGASMLKNYALNGGIQGKTFSQICYDAIQEMYANDVNFAEAMKLIGSKEQFRKDLYQYLNEGTFRI